MRQSITIRFQHLAIVGGLCALLLSAHAAAFGGGTGTITGFQLATCGQEKCVYIRAPIAYLSGIGSSIAFAKADVQVTPFEQKGKLRKQSAKAFKIESTDCDLNLAENRLYFYQISGRPGLQAFYDMASGKIHYLRSE